MHWHLVVLDLETNPDIKVSGSYKDYYILLNKRLKYLQETLQHFKSKWLAMINKTMKVLSTVVKI